MDTIVFRLEKDIRSAYIEMDHIRELHRKEFESFQVNHKLEKMKWHESQVSLLKRIQELETGFGKRKRLLL